MTNPEPCRAGQPRVAKAVEMLAPPPLLTVKPSLLAGRYRLEAPLGHGTASVFRAIDLKTGSRHALKRLPKDAALEAGEYERFVSAITLLSQLCHPNIVTVTALHRDDGGRPFLVMELLDGEDALTHLAGGQRLPLPRVLEITRQVVSALHAAHKSGIIHREFKLSSIFLSMQRGVEGPGAEVVKVVGFGGVKVRALGEQVVRSGVLDAAEYLAPEGQTGQRCVLDERSDQWSLAVAIYRMLSGRLPFTANDEESLWHQIRSLPHPPLADLCSELPQHVARALDRALSKDKAQRFPSLVEFMRALSGQMQGHPCARAEEKSIVALRAEPALLPPGQGAASGEDSQPTTRSCIPAPISMSEVPTVVAKIETDRTVNMEAAVLAQLCAQSRSSEKRRLPPLTTKDPIPSRTVREPSMQPRSVPSFLPGSRLVRERQRQVRRLHSLLLILASCIGLSLGIGGAWFFCRHVTRSLGRGPVSVGGASAHLIHTGAAAVTSGRDGASARLR